MRVEDETILQFDRSPRGPWLTARTLAKVCAESPDTPVIAAVMGRVDHGRGLIAWARRGDNLVLTVVLDEPNKGQPGVIDRLVAAQEKGGGPCQ